MEESVEAFWARFERETGEPVLSKTMGQYFSSPKDRGDWGLFVLSPTGLRFRKTPGQNWFASLFKAASASPVLTAEEDIFIPFASISRISRPRAKFLDKLFGTPFFGILVEFQSEGLTREARFALDPKSDIPARLAEFLKKP